MWGITINNKNKREKNKNIKEGGCIFPFKQKGKLHNECLPTAKGDICATEINPKTRTLKKYGYCIPKKTTLKRRKNALKKN